MKKVRKQIYLEKRQDQQLKRIAEARGISEAEVIRQALDRTDYRVASRLAVRDQSAMEALIKDALARRELGVTGEPYQWNREELYEERLARYGPVHQDEKDEG